jgi:hypothetical protein
MYKLRINLFLSVYLLSMSVFANYTEYVIEHSHNDEIFIINGEVYEAKTYCFNMNEGDKVIFLEGSAFGACVTAKLLNLRTKNSCSVWCE